jgi:serine/threonine-protein kinase PpkA
MAPITTWLRGSASKGAGLGAAIASRLLAMLLLATTLQAQAQPASGRKPLVMAGHAEFYQRILTLPGAQLRIEPGDDGKLALSQVPTFAILYVYSRRAVGNQNWLEVSAGLDGKNTNWLRATEAQDWAVMLVMQYAPPGQRQRVLFFNDAAKLSSIVQDSQGVAKSREIVRAVDAGRHDPNSIIAIEPADRQGTPTFRSKPYLMPILGSKSDEFDAGGRTMLLEVASVNSVPPAATAAKSANMKDLTVGVVFLIDTTSSMGPYINRVRRVVRDFYGRLEREGKLGQTSFGIVGYRNNNEGRPQLEYVAKVFQPLRPGTPPAQVLASFDMLKPATVSTHSWDEDGLFGLYTALNSPEMEWSKFDARILVQISDAGMLDAGDPKAQLRNISLNNIRETADREGIAIIPIHLLTPEAEREGDIAKARRQYQELGRTGDPATNKYIPIAAGDPDRLEEVLRAAGDKLATAISGFVENRTLGRQLVPQQAPLADVLVNELFRVQQTYVGLKLGTDAPPFIRGWAADKDLGNPRNEALQVAVFLTRNQLNNLAQSLRDVLDQAKRAQLAPQSLFDQLRSLSASTAVAPAQRKADSIAEMDLLPSYLKLLPYQSQLLRLTAQSWLDQGFSGQQATIAALDFKLQAYTDINAADVWIDLGAKDRGQMVYPLPMDLLP